MALYNYSAVNASGRKIHGSIIADNEVDLEARLRQLGLDLINYRLSKERKRRSFGRVKYKDIILLCLHMEQLDRAGVPLLEALADVRDSTDSPKLRDALTSIYESVKNGTVFSQALAEHPMVFDSVFTGLIAAGEKTGNLSESFAQLSEHYKWSDEIRRKVRKAIAYPTFLLLMMIGVISILMVFVVPKLTDFIINQGFTIPMHTKLLIATSAVFSSYWYLVLGLPIAVVMLIGVLYRTSEPFAYKMDDLLLRLPVIGPTVRKINLARFVHFFSVMFRSGIDILDALVSAKDVVTNRVLGESILTMRQSVMEGSSLTSSLRLSNQFPMLVVRMFKVGEDSGNMNDALQNVNFFYKREVNDSVDTMVGSLQPILTILLGILIFWVISAVFGPLYESFSKIKF